VCRQGRDARYAWPSDNRVTEVSAVPGTVRAHARRDCACSESSPSKPGAVAIDHIQACAGWARHDCFGSPGCSGLAMPLPRIRAPASTTPALAFVISAACSGRSEPTDRARREPASRRSGTQALCRALASRASRNWGPLAFAGVPIRLVPMSSRSTGEPRCASGVVPCDSAEHAVRRFRFDGSCLLVRARQQNDAAGSHRKERFKL